MPIEFDSVQIPDDTACKQSQLLSMNLVCTALAALLARPTELGFSVRLTADQDGSRRLSVIPYSSLRPTRETR